MQVQIGGFQFAESNHRPDRKTAASLLDRVLLLVSFGSLRAEGEVLTKIDTPAGEVLLEEKDGVRRVTLADKAIYTGTEFMTIYRYFRSEDGYGHLMIRDFTGPIGCPVEYRFITLSPRNDPKVYDAFGHCASDPDLSLSKGTIVIHFADFGSIPGITYQFDGRNLTRRQ